MILWRRACNWASATALAALTTVACVRPAPAPLSGAEAAAIRDTVTVLEHAMNLAVDALDCGTGLEYIGDAPPLFVAAGRVVRNRAALANMCERMVAGRTGAVFDVDTLTAHALDRNAAYVVREGVYTINFVDGTADTRRFVITTIWGRSDAGWKMTHLHESWRALP